MGVMTNEDKEDEDYSAGTLQPASGGRRKPYYCIFPTMEARSVKLKLRSLAETAPGAL